RLRSSRFRRFGSLELFFVAKQHGLSAYDDYLMPSELGGIVTYRFPSIDADNEYYDAIFRDRSSYFELQLRPV
ncbi:hypothetical protein AAVH_43284, partial [Aphelenchoides avenae]